MTVIVQTPPKTTARWLTIAYWVTTGLFGLAMLNGAYGDLSQADYVMEGMVSLGYPSYLATILGVGKLLGAIAILYPGFYRLKEWAYAGFTINLLGAVASHLLAGDPPTTAIAAFVFWLIMVASYVFHYLRTTPS
ncbi:MAG: DoxX family protein [Chloroflexota bacterium]